MLASLDFSLSLEGTKVVATMRSQTGAIMFVIDQCGVVQGERDKE